MRPDFQKAQNTATALLLTQNVSRFHINVCELTLSKHIHITSMQDFCKTTGFLMSDFPTSHCEAFTLKQGDENIILYDDSVSNKARKNWSIAHELGHVLLNHKDDDGISEIEANFFAAQLIAPEIVLLALHKRWGKLSYTDLPLLFNISHQAAKKRIQTLSRRDRYNQGTCDIELLEMYQPLISTAVVKRKVS